MRLKRFNKKEAFYEAKKMVREQNSNLSDEQIEQILKLKRLSSWVNKLNGVLLVCSILAIFIGGISWLFLYSEGWRIAVAGALFMLLSFIVFHFWNEVEKNLFENILK